MSTIHPDATTVAAQATGLRPDQIAQAVQQYRTAVAELEAEPEWRLVISMSGQSFGMLQYAADSTAVTLQVETHGRKEHRYYVYARQPYENYAEARLIELREVTRPRPYDATGDGA